MRRRTLSELTAYLHRQKTRPRVPAPLGEPHTIPHTFESDDMTLRIHLTTDARHDLWAANERNTDAAVGAFAVAWERAAKMLGQGLNLDVTADARASDPEHHEARRDALRELEGAGLEREDADGLLSALWQSAHDLMHTSRPGRWSARRPSPGLLQSLAARMKAAGFCKYVVAHGEDALLWSRHMDREEATAEANAQGDGATVWTARSYFGRAS